MLAHMEKDAFDTVRYLTPWIFVATYKVLEVIHESTKNRLSVIALSNHTFPSCIVLRELIYSLFSRLYVTKV
jgi:hypothetical protein